MNTDLVNHFWSMVDKSGGADACWVWKKTRFHNGYGQCWDGKKNVRAHRYAYLITYGCIPDGLLICHICDNPPCCNPKHLYAGTVQDNMNDKVKRGRCGLSGERNPGAKITVQDVIFIRNAWRKGLATLKELASIFHLNIDHTRDVIRGKHWKHI